MNIIREEISSRGGGIEISLDQYGYPGHRMSAYQNYLGGGLLGRIQNDSTVKDWRERPMLVKVAETLREYLHYRTNPDTEWESATFEEIQNRPVSGY